MEFDPCQVNLFTWHWYTETQERVRGTVLSCEITSPFSLLPYPPTPSAVCLDTWYQGITDGTVRTCTVRAVIWSIHYTLQQWNDRTTSDACPWDTTIFSSFKRELKRIHVDGCRYNEKLNAKTEEVRDLVRRRRARNQRTWLHVNVRSVGVGRVCVYMLCVCNGWIRDRGMCVGVEATIFTVLLSLMKRKTNYTVDANVSSFCFTLILTIILSVFVPGRSRVVQTHFFGFCTTRDRPGFFSFCNTRDRPGTKTEII